MPNTREKIMLLLQERSTISAPQIGAALGLTRAACRYHLRALEMEGRVERVLEHAGSPAGRGRPRQRYRRVAQDAPQALAALCGALLAMVGEENAVLARLAGGLAGAVPSGGTAIQRMNLAVARMNALGARASWEASAFGPRILLRSCPLAALIRSHPFLCDAERQALERLTGQRLRQMASHCDGKAQCIFEPASAGEISG